MFMSRARKERPGVSPAALRESIAGFEEARHAALANPRDADPAYLEFTVLAEGDTNSAPNLRRRLEILLEQN